MNLDPSNTLFPERILICGLGSIGRSHARVINSYYPHIELSALRSGFGPPSSDLDFIKHQFIDFESAFNWSPDAALICSPASLHQTQALILSRRKIPILIEKPLDICGGHSAVWDEIDILAKDVPMLVGYVLRHDKRMQFVKSLIESNEFGKILEADFYCGSWLPDWRPNVCYKTNVSAKKSLGGGVLLEISHELDLARWFFGDLNVTFASLQQSGLLDIDVEDKVIIVARSSLCSLITFRLNFCTNPARRSLLLRFEKGEISCDLLSGIVKLSLRDQHDRHYEIKMNTDERLLFQFQHFIKCIVDKDPPLCSLRDGLSVMRIIDQARSIAL